MNLLQSYEAMLQVSSRMAEAAERQEWDDLNQLQQQRAAIIATLPQSLPPPVSADAAAVRDIIRQIQAHDATVLEYANISREQIGKLIARFSQAR